MIAPISGSPVQMDPAAAAPSAQPAAGQPPVPQAPALQQTVSQAIDAQAAATQKAAEQAAKAQAAAIDKVTSSQPEPMAVRPSQVRFQRDMETGRVAVEVYDAITGEKKGQMPSEQLMKTLSNISHQIGLLLDKTG